MKPARLLTLILLWLAIGAGALADRFWVGPVPWVAAAGNIPAHYEAPAGVTGWIDLRTQSECGTPGTAASGVAFFVTADATTLSASYTNLGTDPERVLTNAQRNSLGTALRLQAVPSTNVLSDILYEALTSQADPTGATRARPIVPNNNLRYEVWLGGNRVRNRAFDKDGPEAANLQIQLRDEYRAARQAVLGGQLPANFHRKIVGYWVRKYRLAYRWFESDDLPDESDLPPSTTITDSFNRADADALGSSSEGWSWTEHLDIDIVSNEAKNPTASVARARADSNLSSADHYAQVKLQTATSDLDGVLVRCSSSADTSYACVGSNAGTRIVFHKIVTGTVTTLATINSVSFANGDVLKCSVSGSTLEAFVNGTSKGTTTDSSITGNLRCGIDMHGSASQRLDDFQAADLSVASPKTWPYYYTPLGLSRRPLLFDPQSWVLTP